MHSGGTRNSCRASEVRVRKCIARVVAYMATYSGECVGACVTHVRDTWSAAVLLELLTAVFFPQTIDIQIVLVAHVLREQHRASRTLHLPLTRIRFDACATPSAVQDGTRNVDAMEACCGGATCSGVACCCALALGVEWRHTSSNSSHAWSSASYSPMRE